MGWQEWKRLSQRPNNLFLIASLALVYLAAGKLGLSMAFGRPGSVVIWPSTGIAIAALVIFGNRVWPGIALGTLLLRLLTHAPILASLGIAAGNTVEALAGAYLVLRFANGMRCFERAQDTFKFALSGVAAAAMGATIGVVSLGLTNVIKWGSFKDVWLSWWLGHAAGAVVIGPILILWSLHAHERLNWAKLGELAILLTSMMVVGQIVFGPLLHIRSYPLEYVCIPFLVWAAFRFGPREAATATLVLAGLAFRGTVRGFGPFALGTRTESLLFLQTFIAIVAVMTLSLAVMTAERTRAEEQIRNLAVTDPLTGLANYRKLIDVLDFEIRRFSRTGRPFSVLLLDMDGLKAINDLHGHLIGSRALRRLGDILRVYCRDIDTAARYGGDEFVLVIPETGRKEAQQVANRIRERVSEDAESPRISVSIGSAVYPRDGETRDALLEAADRALYEMKRKSNQESQPARKDGAAL
jgi:diguanylate cyclase (GGDEF)-like protein